MKKQLSAADNVRYEIDELVSDYTCGCCNILFDDEMWKRFIEKLDSMGIQIVWKG